ncbi:MAG: T9SS type A sorting domain-containing protein [Crocinitomicaceae bacterium]
MKKFLFITLVSLFSTISVAQDWHTVGNNFTGIQEKKIVVNNDGYVGMFFKDNAGGNGFFWIYDPNSMSWGEVNGNFNSESVLEMDLETDGVDFFIAYQNSSQSTIVWRVSATGSLTDYTSGIAPSFFSNGAFDMFFDKSTGQKYIAGINGDLTGYHILEHNGSNWDTLALDFTSSLGIFPFSFYSVSGYVNDQDIYLAMSFNAGNDEIAFVHSQVGTGVFNYANGLPGTTPISSSKIILAGDGTGYPVLVMNKFTVPDSLLYYEYDGGGFSVMTGLNFPGNNVINYDVAVEGGKKMVLATIDAASDASQVFEWTGSNFQNAHPGMVGLGFIDDYETDLALHPLTGKAYVIVEKQTDFIQTYALNSMPYVDNITLAGTCIGSYTYILDPIYVKDDDSDSTWIRVTSTMQAIIADSDIYTYFVNRNGQITSYETEAFGMSDGTVDIKVVLSDGIIRDTLTYQVTVFPAPSIDVSSIAGYSVCNTNGPLDLNPLISPAGGYWGGSAVDNEGILDPIQVQQDPTVFYDYYDANGCYAFEEITLNPVTGPEIQALAATPASCGNADGSGEIQVVAGSTNDYFIQWSTGDTNVTMVNNLESGQYVITVVDTNNCTNSKNYIVPSADITVTYSTTNPSCYNSTNGAIDLTVSGNGPFTYYWINGETTEDLNNISGGFYSVMITDNNGCTTEEIVNLQSPSGMLSLDDSSPYDGQCLANDGGVSLSVSGGVTPYSFLWSNAQTSQNLTNVAPGTYSVTVTDANNCQVTETYTVSTYDGPYIYLESVTNASCNQNDGEIDITISTSQNPVASISWSNGPSTEDITGLAAGSYTVVATDVAGCEGHATFVVAPVKPAVQPLCLVTVDSLTTTNVLVWERTNLTGISHYNIYRETGAIGNYPLVGTVSATNESIWNDVSASPLVTSWRYKLTQVDDCGIESNKSPHHKTMHVSISKGLGTNYNIFWDDYEGIPYSTINLWRYDLTNGLQLLQNLPANVYSYTDDPGIDTLGLDYFVGFDLAAPCTSSRAQDYNGTRSNRSAGVFNPGSGTGLSIFENNDLSDQILIYPNPNNGEFTLQFGNTLVGEKKIRVIDARGKIVTYKKAFNSTYDLNMVHVEPGIYFVEVFNGNKKGVQKIVVQ